MQLIQVTFLSFLVITCTLLKSFVFTYSQKTTYSPLCKCE